MSLIFFGSVTSVVVSVLSVCMTLSRTMHLRVLLREEAIKLALLVAKLEQRASAYALIISDLCFSSRRLRLAAESFRSPFICVSKSTSCDREHLLSRIGTESGSIGEPL